VTVFPIENIVEERQWQRELRGTLTDIVRIISPQRGKTIVLDQEKMLGNAVYKIGALTV
jgi:hypothetical protein